MSQQGLAQLRALKDERRANKLCLDCGKPAGEDRVRCERCMNLQARARDLLNRIPRPHCGPHRHAVKVNMTDDWAEVDCRGCLRHRHPEAEIHIIGKADLSDEAKKALIDIMRANYPRPTED